MKTLKLFVITGISVSIACVSCSGNTRDKDSYSNSDSAYYKNNDRDSLTSSSDTGISSPNTTGLRKNHLDTAR